MAKERSSNKETESASDKDAAQAPETAEAAQGAMAQDEKSKAPDTSAESASGAAGASDVAGNPDAPTTSKPKAHRTSDSTSQDAFADIPAPAQAELDAADPLGAVPPISPDYRGSVGAGSGFGDLSLNEREAMEAFLGSDDDYASLPNPETFNAYPPEVQRKIMEWTDRDVKARRDDESRRQDALMRARVDHARRRQMIPAVVIVLAVLCGAITGIITGNPLFPLVFLIIPVVVAVALIVADDDPQGPDGRRNPFLRNIRR